MRMALLPPLLAALAACPWPAHAGDPASPAVLATTRHPMEEMTPLTLSEAIHLALTGHPVLAAARSELEAAEAARLQAGARPNPVLEAEVEDSRRETRSTTVLLTQPIELGGQRSARLAVADRATDIANSQLTAQRAGLRANVSTAFFDTVAAQERVTLAQASLDLAGRATDAATKRVTAGKVSPVEQTKAQVAQAGSRIELQQAQSELRSAIQTLAAAIGRPHRFDRVLASVEDLPAVPSQADLEARMAASPTLRQARLDVERLGALAQLERARRTPDVTLGVGAKRSEELGRTQPVITLSVPIPVFNTNRGAELEALRRQDKARHEVDAAVLRLRSDVAAAAERLGAATAEAEALRAEVIPGAQTAFEAASKGFELGKFAFLDVLDAQRTLIQARMQRLRALAEAHRAAAEIDRLLGTGAMPLVAGQQ